MTRILITGGTIVDPTGERRADVHAGTEEQHEQPLGMAKDRAGGVLFDGGGRGHRSLVPWF